MALEAEGNKLQLQDVLARPGNDKCADCGNPGKANLPPSTRPPAPLLKTRRPVESAHPAAGARVPFEPLYTSRGYMSQLALQNRTSLSESDDKGPQIPEDKVDQSRPDSGLWTYKSEP